MSLDSHRLAILTPKEIEALYSPPRFTEEERTLYFDLSIKERAAIEAHTVSVAVHLIRVRQARDNHTSSMRLTAANASNPPSNTLKTPHLEGHAGGSDTSTRQCKFCLYWLPAYRLAAGRN